MKIFRSLLITLLMAACQINTSSADSGAAQPAFEPLSSFPQTSLTIVTPDGRQHPFRIWVADTDAHREQGLMMINSLEISTGMLFIFDRPQIVQMWMKNTLIPLDMVFIDADGRIDSIAANTTPMSLKIISARNPVLAVLEIAGGSAAKLGIKTGAIVKHPAFASLGGRR